MQSLRPALVAFAIALIGCDSGSPYADLEEYPFVLALSGRITDVDTGEGLPHAYAHLAVYIGLFDSGSALRVRTDSTGRYEISTRITCEESRGGSVDSPVHLVATAEGYSFSRGHPITCTSEPQEIDVQMSPCVPDRWCIDYPDNWL